MCRTPWKYNFPVKPFFQLVWGEIGTPKPFLMTIQSFWVRKYFLQTYPIPFSSQFQVFWIQFRAPTQAQLGPGRARICPAGIFPTSAFSRRSGIAQGAAAEVENLPQEVENPPFGKRVGQILAGQGFSRPPLILKGRAKPCPA